VALVRYGAHPSSASRDRFLRQVLADPERARTEWGDRWAALEAYDIDQATRPDVDAANRELVRRIGARRIAPDQLRRISVGGPPRLRSRSFCWRRLTNQAFPVVL